MMFEQSHFSVRACPNVPIWECNSKNKPVDSITFSGLIKAKEGTSGVGYAIYQKDDQTLRN